MSVAQLLDVLTATTRALHTLTLSASLTSLTFSQTTPHAELRHLLVGKCPRQTYVFDRTCDADTDCCVFPILIEEDLRVILTTFTEYMPIRK